MPTLLSFLSHPLPVLLSICSPFSFNHLMFHSPSSFHLPFFFSSVSLLLSSLVDRCLKSLHLPGDSSCQSACTNPGEDRFRLITTCLSLVVSWRKEGKKRGDGGWQSESTWKKGKEGWPHEGGSKQGACGRDGKKERMEERNGCKPRGMRGERWGRKEWREKPGQITKGLIH